MTAISEQAAWPARRSRGWRRKLVAGSESIFERSVVPVGPSSYATLSGGVGPLTKKMIEKMVSWLG